MNARTERYSGWKNRQTWNCALWIGNDEGLYNCARDFMANYKGRAPYKRFCDAYGLSGTRNPDNIAWTGTKLDYCELNDMMRELRPEN